MASDNIEYDDGYWPKSYFLSLGMGATYTNGDLNEHHIALTDSAGNKSSVYPPSMSFFATPDLSIGVNIRSFTLDFNFQYWKSSQDLTKQEESEDTRIWRAGFEFTYNLFWPEDFQVGLGIGYSYTSITTKNSAFHKSGKEQSSIMGSGAAFIANARYYFNDYIAVVPAIKAYRNWFKNVQTDQSGNCDLDPFMWQTYILTSLSVLFQF